MLGPARLNSLGFLLSVALLAVLCVAPPQARAEQHEPPPQRQALLAGYAAELRASLARGVVPIIDVEHHWSGKLPLAELIGKMDAAGVALTWLGQNEKHGSAFGLSATAEHPTRLVPTTIHGDGPRWHGRDPSLLDELAADVHTGRYFALGEFEARHYVSSTNSRDVHLPADSQSFEAVFRLAEESGLPLLLHHEAEDALLPELERMLARHPKAVVIWCHVGRNRDRSTWTAFPTPLGVRAYLDKYPNLYFDLNQASPGSRHSGTRQVDSVLYDIDPSRGGKQPGARLNDEWRLLLEERSDRFLFGTDVNTGRWDKYERVVENFRELVLRRLSPQAGARIAYGNAWRLMGGQPLR